VDEGEPATEPAGILDELAARRGSALWSVLYVLLYRIKEKWRSNLTDISHPSMFINLGSHASTMAFRHHFHF
jgi:hypothetical protein